MCWDVRIGVPQGRPCLLPLAGLRTGGTLAYRCVIGSILPTPRLFAASSVPEGVYLTGQVAGLTVTLAGSHAHSVSAAYRLCFHPLLLTQ